MMKHRVTVILERIQMGNITEISHDEKMALVWRLIEETDKNVHKNDEKMYTWCLNEQGERKYSLLFSSIDTTILEQFTKRAEELKNQGLTVGSNIWKITDVIPLEDYPFLNPTMRLQSLSGAYVYQLVEEPHNDTGEIMQFKHSVHIGHNPTLAANIIKHRLVRRANTVYGTEYTDNDVTIRYIELIPGSEPVHYKHRTIGSQMLTFRIKAPKEVMETALYGGVGHLTGSGFGSVVIA